MSIIKKTTKNLFQRSFDLSERFKVLTETSPDCIKLFDTEGNLLYINPGGIEEHNLISLENALEKKWKMTDSIIENDHKKLEEAIKKAEQGEVSTIEIRHTPDTNRAICLETIAPVKNKKGEVVAIFGVSRDITPLKKTEKKLEKIMSSLEKEVKIRTSSLKEKIDELEQINKLMVGREMRIIELKEENDRLRQQLESNIAAN